MIPILINHEVDKVIGKFDGEFVTLRHYEPSDSEKGGESAILKVKVVEFSIERKS